MSKNIIEGGVDMKVLVVGEHKVLPNIGSDFKHVKFDVVKSTDIVDIITQLKKQRYRCIMTLPCVEELSTKTYVRILKALSPGIKIVLVSHGIDELTECELYDNGVDEIVKSDNEKVICHKFGKLVSSIAVMDENILLDHSYKVEVHLLRNQVYLDGVELYVSNKEYDLLVYFLSNPERVITRKELEKNVWGSSIEGLESRTIDIYIMKLRRLISLHCITTVRGKGYIWGISKSQ